MNFEQELKTALEASRASGDIQMSLFGKKFEVDFKQDKSPVTNVDKECELAIINRISDVFPNDGFLGEETGSISGKSGRRWIIDPIDGTRPFIYGLPFFSTLIAMEEDDERLIGVIHLPAMNQTYYATRGSGAFCNRKNIKVSGTKNISKMHGAVCGWNEFKNINSERLQNFCKKAGYLFGFNDAYSYACVASGKMDFVISIVDKPWDNASPSVIVREAGGIFSDFEGNDRIDKGCSVVSNGRIHDKLINALAGTDKNS
ncbi:MAG: inositol monophosphatase [bacterium]